MGISNLLPLLEKSTRQCHVSEFRGLSVAVDSYCWLHRGARSCALQLARGDDTDAYVAYCMKFVNMLLSYDIKPIMVFDGRHLPAKLKTEEKRREAKKQAKKQGLEYLRVGQTSDAYKYFCQCIDVTPAMALALIKACRKVQVDCIVAPYEADAQLAFFSLKGVVSCVITEDSDLLLFGCKKVLFKMDQNGNGQLVEDDKLYLSMKIRRDQFIFEKFRHMCILSGCDYLDSLPGIGLKNALKFITMTAETNPTIFLDKLPRYLNKKALTVPEEYKENFLIADATFKHQIVFDPFTRVLVPLHLRESDSKYCMNAGDFFDNSKAFQLALGNLDPLTMKRIDNWDPNFSSISDYSIWSLHFKPRSLSPKKSTPKQIFSKRNTLDSQVAELTKQQHDEQVEKELEFYKTAPEIAEAAAVVEDEPMQSPQTESEESPVLGNNPFLKKISKFQVTPTSSAQKIVSRFFQKPQERNGENKSSSSSSMTPEEDDDIIEEMRKRCEEKYVVTPTGSSESGIASEGESASLGTQASEMDASQTDEEIPDLPLIDCECVLEIEEGEVHVPGLKTSAVGASNVVKEVKGKKRKSESFSKTGTKKAKKQQTIQHMFMKMKMN